jgi:L-amino acid N-acyltransferase YncA
MTTRAAISAGKLVATAKLIWEIDPVRANEREKKIQKRKRKSLRTVVADQTRQAHTSNLLRSNTSASRPTKMLVPLIHF